MFKIRYIFILLSSICLLLSFVIYKHPAPDPVISLSNNVIKTPSKLHKFNAFDKSTVITPNTSTTLDKYDWGNIESIQTYIKPNKDAESISEPKTTLVALPVDKYDKKITTNHSPSVSDIWDWLPSITTSNRQTHEAPEQTELMQRYGNSIGTIIKMFTLKAGNQTKILGVFMQERDNTSKSQKVIDLGNQYIQLSEDLKSIQPPNNLAKANTNLINSYRAVGEATIKIAKSTTDEDALFKIYEYNSVVDDFAKSFIKIYNLFGSYGVTFNYGEGGDIFIPSM